MNAIHVPEILLPSDGVEMEAWAVNACDQYTSDPEYWREVEKLTRGKPSAFNLIYPEIYLSVQPEQRIARINEYMRGYLSGGIFKKVTGGFVLVERTTPSGTRTGIVLAIDLEEYSFEANSKSLIRATEGTITERIPPRVQIRKDAPLELTHVMLLYDDKNKAVLNSVKRGTVLYDFDLMCGGGHIKGTFIENPEEVESAFYSLIGGEGAGGGILFAAGDGNHSLATAKACWESLKPTLTEKEREVHPARYALAEAVNIYDKALTFEPIHRFVKTDKPDLFIKNLKTSGGGKAYIVVRGEKKEIAFNSSVPAGLREIDAYISSFVSANGGEVDYVHGENDLKKLTGSGVGVLVPAIKKEDFFSLIKNGVLPRKTFSMGEGYEKRYYLEAKAIK